PRGLQGTAGSRVVMLHRFAFALMLFAAACAADGNSPGTGGTGGAGGTGGSGGSMPGTPPARSCDTTVTYQPTGRVAEVAVAGEWNQWQPAAQPLAGPDSHGAYTAKLTLPAGAYGYKFVIADTAGAQTWQLDSTNPYTKWVGGVENSVLEIDDCQVPALVFGKLDRSPSGTIHAEIQYLDAATRAGFDPQALSVELDGAPATGVMVRDDGFITLDATGLGK